MLRAIWFGALVLLLACSRHEGSGPTDVGTAAVDGAAQLVEGKRLFLIACANCHGVDGRGELMRSLYPTLSDLGSSKLHARLDDKALRQLIAQGRESMPGFGTIYSEAQIAALAAYVRTFGK